MSADPARSSGPTKRRPNLLSRGKSAASARWAGLKKRHPGLQHVLAAWRLMQDNNGSQYAAAITYFSFLALFPLLLLVVAITGFVLHAHPAAQQSLLAHITANVPGDLGATLQSSVRTAITARTGVGIIGLVGVLLTGLGWIGNLRAAIDGVWGRRPPKRNFFLAKLMNLFVLAGLGLGLVVSLGLTVVGTALTDQALRLTGLGQVTGVHYLVIVLGIALAVAGDVLIFWWVLVRLPDMGVPRRVGLQGALLAAVGFEALKIIGTVTIAKTAHSPTAGPFAGLLAVLIWIQLVARYLLFCAAWTATCLDGTHGADNTAQAGEGPAAASPAAPALPVPMLAGPAAPSLAGPAPAPIATTAVAPALLARARALVATATAIATAAGAAAGAVAGAVAGAAVMASVMARRNSRRRDDQADRSQSSR